MRHFARSTLVALSLIAAPALASSPPQQPAPAAAQETLTVRTGNAKTLQAPGVTRVAIGDPEIADIDVADGGVLRIEGRKAGETTLLVWTGAARKEYRIVVEK
jgi:pilus assembly protein CpaC